jgi:hypothetical protein
MKRLLAQFATKWVESFKLAHSVLRVRAALERLNPALPPEAISAGVDELIRDRSAMLLAAANREVYSLLKEGPTYAVFLKENRIMSINVTDLDGKCGTGAEAGGKHKRWRAKGEPAKFPRKESQCRAQSGPGWKPRRARGLRAS